MTSSGQKSGMDGGRLGWGMITLAWQLHGRDCRHAGHLPALAVNGDDRLWLVGKTGSWLLHLAGETPPVVVATPSPCGSCSQRNSP